MVLKHQVEYLPPGYIPTLLKSLLRNTSRSRWCEDAATPITCAKGRKKECMRFESNTRVDVPSDCIPFDVPSF